MISSLSESFFVTIMLYFKCLDSDVHMKQLNNEELSDTVRQVVNIPDNKRRASSYIDFYTASAQVCVIITSPIDCRQLLLNPFASHTPRVKYITGMQLPTRMSLCVMPRVKEKAISKSFKRK